MGKGVHPWLVIYTATTLNFQGLLNVSTYKCTNDSAHSSTDFQKHKVLHKWEIITYCGKLKSKRMYVCACVHVDTGKSFFLDFRLLP